MTKDEIEGFAVPDDAKSSAVILSALKKAEREFNDWQATCQAIDEIYSLEGAPGSALIGNASWSDSRLDLFWASFEVLKPAVYAKPPVPAVAPLFADNKQVNNVTAELLERASICAMAQMNINDIMLGVRDDLLFAGRGVPWIVYESDKDGQRVCGEHVDRTDFLHEPARKWAEVGWVAKRAWLTRSEARKRFRPTSGDAYQNAKYMVRRDYDSDVETTTRKAGFWEVWHRADNKVYWVAEGVDVLLDSGEPHLKLKDFFPCPRPAYGTLRRRSLVPVPDWERYAIHFSKISELTGRIYLLLDSVRMKGLIPAGGDVGDAVEQLMASDDDQMLVPVPGAALLAGGTSNFVQWMPLQELASAITGLIEARTQLINDFYQLSGISDIMRGATEAQETLGAQQLKSQYGSVRVREKIDELQRVAADFIAIMAEIMAEKFSKETLLEMSQMDLQSKASIENRIKDIEKAAKQELQALGEKAQEMAAQAQGQADPAQAEAMMKQAQQQILAKYAPMLAEAEEQIPIEDVMRLLRDDRARSFTFDVASDSTILTDELAEKASRNEFLTQFTNASQGLMGLMSMGDQGAQLAGEMLKFVLAPYRAGRPLDAAINAFIDAAPEMAKAAQAQAGKAGEDSEALAEANKMLADAEQKKAQAAMAGVQAKAALDQAENQRKFADMQMKAQADAVKAAQENDKLRLQLADTQANAEKTAAEIDKLRAQTAQILSSIGLDARKQDLDEYQAVESARSTRVNEAVQAENAATERDFRERGEQRADRQQEFTEQNGDI